MPRKYRTIRGR